MLLQTKNFILCYGHVFKHLNHAIWYTQGEAYDQQFCSDDDDDDDRQIQQFRAEIQTVTRRTPTICSVSGNRLALYYIQQNWLNI